MEAQPRGATVIYMCVDAHNYPSGRRVLQYKNGQYTACWSCAATSYFNQITIHYIYTQKKGKKTLITHDHALCTECISKMLPVYVFGIFKAESKLPRLPDSKRSSIYEVQFVRNWGV